MDRQSLAGRDAAEDLELADGGEAQVLEWMITAITLSQDAAELGQGLDHDHAGQQGLAGEVAFEKGFIALQCPAACR